LPVAFEGPPNELAGLSMFLDEQRAAVLRKLDGLSDAQAIEHPTASEFCMLTLVKHFAYVERRLTAARALVVIPNQVVDSTNGGLAPES
jgi:hypothetical protein